LKDSSTRVDGLICQRRRGKAIFFFDFLAGYFMAKL
jgi:hypothetical protein